MFELGFFELLLFGAIALIVLGPEKLPHAARVAGAWYARIRRQITSIQGEIEKEVHLMETRQKLEEELRKLNELEANLKQQATHAEQSFNQYIGSTEAIRTDEYGQPYYFLISSSQLPLLAPPAPLMRPCKLP